MDLNEAQEILKQAGYLCEFRDSSNLLDKETEHTPSHYSDDKVSWNNAKVRYRTNIKGEDTTKAANKEARMANELIAKVDEVCNKFEDYDYFVKRYDVRTIQVRRTEESDTGVPFLQISVNGEDDGSFTFCCGIGRVSQELRQKTYKDYTDPEDVLKWVSACLANGYINESSNPSFDAAASLLAENYLLNEDYRDFLPDPDPTVEKAILSNMNADDSRSYGPDSAYDAAYKIVSESNPELDIPSDRSEYEEVYGYDPDDPPREVINRIFG